MLVKIRLESESELRKQSNKLKWSNKQVRIFKGGAIKIGILDLKVEMVESPYNQDSQNLDYMS